MDGRGRALDNVFIERLWRTGRHKEVYLKDYVSLVDAHAQLDQFFRFYNTQRPLSRLRYQSPARFAAHFTPSLASVGLRPPPAKDGQPTADIPTSSLRNHL